MIYALHGKLSKEHTYQLNRVVQLLILKLINELNNQWQWTYRSRPEVGTGGNSRSEG